MANIDGGDEWLLVHRSAIDFDRNLTVMPVGPEHVQVKRKEVARLISSLKETSQPMAGPVMSTEAIRVMRELLISSKDAKESIMTRLLTGTGSENKLGTQRSKRTHVRRTTPEFLYFIVQPPTSSTSSTSYTSSTSSTSPTTSKSSKRRKTSKTQQVADACFDELIDRELIENVDALLKSPSGCLPLVRIKALEADSGHPAARSDGLAKGLYASQSIPEGKFIAAYTAGAHVHLSSEDIAAYDAHPDIHMYMYSLDLPEGYNLHADLLIWRDAPNQKLDQKTERLDLSIEFPTFFKFIAPSRQIRSNVGNPMTNPATAINDFRNTGKRANCCAVLLIRVGLRVNSRNRSSTLIEPGNLEVEPVVVLMTERAIAAEEEILQDYMDGYWDSVIQAKVEKDLMDCKTVAFLDNMVPDHSVKTIAQMCELRGLCLPEINVVALHSNKIIQMFHAQKGDEDSNWVLRVLLMRAIALIMRDNEGRIIVREVLRAMRLAEDTVAELRISSQTTSVAPWTWSDVVSNFRCRELLFPEKHMEPPSDFKNPFSTQLRDHDHDPVQINAAQQVVSSEARAAISSVKNTKSTPKYGDDVSDMAAIVVSIAAGVLKGRVNDYAALALQASCDVLTSSSYSGKVERSIARALDRFGKLLVDQVELTWYAAAEQQRRARTLLTMSTI